MEVFKVVSERFGGPLALGEYIDPSVPSPAQHEQQHPRTAPCPTTTTAAVSATDTYVDRKNLFDAVLNDTNFPLVATFLLSGVRVDAARPGDGATPLHVAVAGTTRPISDLLYRRHHSSRSASLDDGGISDSEEKLDPPCPNRLIIAFLIDNGADIDAGTAIGGETPLMVACASQNVRAVELLLAKGAAIDARDANGRTCLSYAVLHPHMLQTLLLWAGEEQIIAMAREMSLLHAVCRVPGTRLPALYLVEQLGLDVNAAEKAGADGTDADKKEGRAAAAGAANGSGEESGPVHVPVKPVHGGGGDTPLHCAVETGDLALVVTLLAKGANAQALNTETGRTPRDLAEAARTRALQQPLRLPFTILSTQYHLPPPAALVRWWSACVTHVGMRWVDVESAPRWGAAAQAVAIDVLIAYCATAPAARVEVYLARLENSGATAIVGSGLLRCLRALPPCGDVAALRHWGALLTLAVLPQVLMYTVACVFGSFLVNLAAVAALGAAFQLIKGMDERAVGGRSLRTPGFALGVLAMQARCLQLSAAEYDSLAASTAEVPSSMLTMWLTVSAMGCALLLIPVLLSPGTVDSTAGQRRGIYASLAHAKKRAQGKGGSALPRELVYGVDLDKMVKKPLRAHRCPQTGRVVLRYDHYCAYLASPIGARNHRAFLYGLVSLLSLLASAYYRACTYDHHLTLAKKSLAVDQSPGLAAGLTGGDVEQMRGNVLFSTPRDRLGYMYTQVMLPLTMLLVLWELYKQLSAIARGVTLFDLDHANTESSIYCFTLGSRVYSLFDKGSWANLKGFFLFTDDLDAITYRVPTISDELKAIVEEHQRWQVAGQGCGCHHPGDAGGVPDGLQGQAHPPPPSSQQQQQQQQPVEDVAHSTDVITEVTAHPPAGPQTQSGSGQPSNAQVVRSLAQHVFQEMIRSGTADLGAQHYREAHPSLMAGAGEGKGAPPPTESDWEAAVEQARQMHRFFTQSLQTAGPGLPGV